MEDLQNMIWHHPILHYLKLMCNFSLAFQTVKMNETLTELNEGRRMNYEVNQLRNPQLPCQHGNRKSKTAPVSKS